MKPLIRKNFLSIILAIVAAGFVVAGMPTSAGAAVTVTDGDYTYSYSGSAWQLYSYNGDEQEITLPSSYNGSPVKTILNRCFASSGLVSVTVPDGYTTIGDYAFANSANLSELVLPKTVTKIGIGAFSGTALSSMDLSCNKLSEISSFLFKGCALLESVALPDSLTDIGESAFRESGIKSLVIPESITKLKPNTFKDTPSLESVDLPSSLTSIGASCFENSGIIEIALPETLTTIGESAFRNADSLTELYIPYSVSSIGGYALYPMSIQSKINVVCFKDSYADTYCYENFVMNTTAYDRVFGDANLSGAVDISDATLIQKYTAGLRTIDNPCAKILCDANADGWISVRDATLIQMYIAEIIPQLPY